MVNANADPIVRGFGEQLTVPANTGVGRAYNLPPGASRVLLEPTAAMRYQWTPAIRQIWFFDDSASVNHQWISLTKEVFSTYHDLRVPRLINGARDASAAYPGNTGGTLFSMTSSDAIYYGCVAPIGGLWQEVSGANDQNQAVSVAYSNNAGFVDIGTVTDGTDSTGTLAQDGAWTWTIPERGRSWQPHKLRFVTDDKTVPREANQEALFWLKATVDGTLGTATAIDNVAAMAPQALGGAEANEGGITVKADVEYTQDHPQWHPIPDKVGAIHVLSQATATTAQVSWLMRP